MGDRGSQQLSLRWSVSHNKCQDSQSCIGRLVSNILSSDASLLPEALPALWIKFKLPGLAPRIMHDLAPATPPVCLSPPIPQHLQFDSSSDHNAAVPQREQLFLIAHFPLCLTLPDMPLAALPGPTPPPALPSQILCEPPSKSPHLIWTIPLQPRFLCLSPLVHLREQCDSD